MARGLPHVKRVYLLGDAGGESLGLMRWLTQQWRFVIRQNGRTNIAFEGRTWIKLGALAIAASSEAIGWVRVTQHQAGWYWLVLHGAKGEDKPWYLLAHFSAPAAKLTQL